MESLIDMLFEIAQQNPVQSYLVNKWLIAVNRTHSLGKSEAERIQKIDNGLENSEKLAARISMINSL